MCCSAYRRARDARSRCHVAVFDPAQSETRLRAQPRPFALTRTGVHSSSHAESSGVRNLFEIWSDWTRISAEYGTCEFRTGTGRSFMRANAFGNWFAASSSRGCSDLLFRAGCPRKLQLCFLGGLGLAGLFLYAGLDAACITFHPNSASRRGQGCDRRRPLRRQLSFDGRSARPDRL